MTDLTTFRHLPGNLSFKRCHVNSDAIFSQLIGQNEQPVNVVEHGIRGTQNVNGDSSKDISNIQITQSAKMDPKSDILLLAFQMSFLPITEALFSCASGVDKENARAFERSVRSFKARALTSKGLEEVARRMARNTANGRWTGRSRSIASTIKITVRVIDIDGVTLNEFIFDNARKVPLNDFSDYTMGEIELGREIASQLRGESLATIDVVAELRLRVRGAEVFPSQNYLNIDKKNDPNAKGFSRSLYKVGTAEPVDKFSTRIMGQAALRDQRVFNALRTIDTWYPYFKEEGIPIAVEPLGANLALQAFCRPGDASAFELLKRLNTIDPDSDDGMFMIACFERGGVFGENEKSRKAELKSDAETSAKDSKSKAGRAKRNVPTPAEA